MSGEIINRVANSPVITFRIEDYYPEGERVTLDIKDRLFQGMILRERELRAWVKEHDWQQYQDKHVALLCSADALIQTWAWMLLQSHLQPYARTVVVGSPDELETSLFRQELDKIDFSSYQDRPVVLKGCSSKKIPAAVYAEATRRLLPFVKKLSFGEPCSTVPIYTRSTSLREQE